MHTEYGSIAAETAAHVRSLMEGEHTGHDWLHVERVWTNARRIAEGEDCDRIVVELAALLHDLEDHKFSGDPEAGARAARHWLSACGAAADVIDHVVGIVRTVSFSKGLVPDTIEGQVVQDADRLDALGAVGVARCFAYGASTGQPIYDPEGDRHSIQHFYDKLLKLRDLMNTETGRRLADERHRFMEAFLDRFMDEVAADTPAESG